MPLILMMRCGRSWCDVADDMRIAGVDPGRIEGIGKHGTVPDVDRPGRQRCAEFEPGDIPGYRDYRDAWCEAFAIATFADADDLINLKQWANQ